MLPTLLSIKVRRPYFLVEWNSSTNTPCPGWEPKTLQFFRLVNTFLVRIKGCRWNLSHSQAHSFPFGVSRLIPCLSRMKVGMIAKSILSPKLVTRAICILSQNLLGPGEEHCTQRSWVTPLLILKSYLKFSTFWRAWKSRTMKPDSSYKSEKELVAKNFSHWGTEIL